MKSFYADLFYVLSGFNPLFLEKKNLLSSSDDYFLYVFVDNILFLAKFPSTNYFLFGFNNYLVLNNSSLITT